MNAKEAIKTALTSTKDMLGWYLSDLSDADVLVRPVPAANHIAWQLGHLIESEGTYFVKMIPGAQYPPLPPDLKEQHGKAMAASDSTKGFYTKQRYLDLFNQVRGATLAAVDKLSDVDLDKPTPPEWKDFAPTVGALLLLHANHVLMHAGQFTVVRRKLNKPIIF